MSFNKFLNKALLEKGWKATELAKRSGVSNTCISNYLHGYTEPSEKNLQKILDALGMDYKSESTKKSSKDWTNRMSVSEAAQLLGTSPRTIRAGLITGSLKFGAAVKNGNSYTYLIWPKKFTEITGIELQ